MSALIQIMGGVGVFLIGMVILTEGLKMLTGAKLTRFLAHTTKSPLSGVLTGTLSTAILQSSSATTVAAVGFVSAGLLTFPQALGIIFGANLGTTVTGWMVALLGFKLKLGHILLPVIFIGIMLRLFSRPPWAQAGYAMAGFGLIFVGIDILQQAASEFDLITPETLLGDDIIGRLQLVGIGIVLTVVTQSSSAGMAIALVAVNAELMQFTQAAALVIGMDVGTTITAAIATLGGNTNTRRTGFSHVVYNCLTATGAFILVIPFSEVWEHITGAAIRNNAEIALVAFHSCFNLIGVIVILPFAQHFARMMEIIFPSTPSPLSIVLDKKLLKEPSVALFTVEKVIQKELLSLLRLLNRAIGNTTTNIEAQRSEFCESLKNVREIRGYLDKINIPDSQLRESGPLIALIHATDHIERLARRCSEDLDRTALVHNNPELSDATTLLDRALQEILPELENDNWLRALSIAKEAHTRIDDLEHPRRAQIYEDVARGEMSVTSATDYADSLRWLTRVSRHIYRSCHYIHDSGLR